MGPRQIASVSLVVVVLLAVFSGVSYLIGKSAEPVPAALAPSPVAQVPAEVPKLPADAQASRASLFADPVPGAVYLQVGAVEKSVAEVWVERLRSLGLDAFVTAGASDRIFLVLVGPLPAQDAYRHAKDALDRIAFVTSAPGVRATLDSNLSNSAGRSTLDTPAGPEGRNR